MINVTMETRKMGKEAAVMSNNRLAESLTERKSAIVSNAQDAIIMNKAIVMALLMFGLVIGVSAQEVFAVEQTNQAEGMEKAEKGWSQAIKTQLGLAKAKVALLKARSEIWLHKNKEASR